MGTEYCMRALHIGKAGKDANMRLTVSPFYQSSGPMTVTDRQGASAASHLAAADTRHCQDIEIVIDHQVLIHTRQEMWPVHQNCRRQLVCVDASGSELGRPCLLLLRSFLVERDHDAAAGLRLHLQRVPPAGLHP